jgi:hypothetical protein
MYLTEIEKDFPGVQVPDPFLFFIEYLGEVNYHAQQKTSGVVILPYRTAAPAPFDCHIVIGASQSGLSAIFSRLNFLPRHKREKIGLADEDASAVFINLHKANSFKRAAFFCAEHSFSGFAIPHSRLKKFPKPRLRYGEEPEHSEKFYGDLFRRESDFYRELNLISGTEPPNQKELPDANGALFLHDTQAEGFEAWASRRKQLLSSGGVWAADESLLALIRRRFCGDSFSGKYSVSASSLEPYYQCSLKWLFERALSIENVQIEADLMAENIAGLVYHAALNLFFAELKGQALAPPDYRDDTPLFPALYRDVLDRSVNTVFDSFPCLPPGNKPVMSALTARLLSAEKNVFYYRLEQCLAVFLSYFAHCLVSGSEAMYQSERDTYFFNGIVDCILEYPPDWNPPGASLSESGGNAKTIIVDFKSNTMPDLADCTGEGGRGLMNFQLPMYLCLAEEKEQKEIHTALFFSILKAEPRVLFGCIEDCKKGVRLPRKDKDLILRDSGRFNAIMDEFFEKARRFAREIESGQFSVFETDFEKCLECKHHRICRTVYRIDQARNFAPGS